MTTPPTSDPQPEAPLPDGPPPPVEHRWGVRKLRQFWPLIPLGAILFALMLSDLDVIGYTPFGSNPCSLEDLDQSGISARFYGPLTQLALPSKADSAAKVILVTIDANTEPPGLLTNACDSRMFLARLVGDLNTLGARVIMIDKYFSPDFCADEAKTQLFINSLEASHARVIVGQPTHALADSSQGCLALSPRLEFDATPASKTCKVCFGLNRLNSDVLKIPLRWPVFNEPPAANSSGIQPAMSLPSAPGPAPTPVDDPSKGNGLALMAAEAFSPGIADQPKLKALLAAQRHPYTTFPPLPAVNAMTAMCNAEPAHVYGLNGDPKIKAEKDLCMPWIRTPDQMAELQRSFDGKIAVVGDLSEQDMHPFPGGPRPGVFLQASYVQSILEGRFLQQVPLLLTLIVLVLYVIGVYCLYWAHDVHGEPRLSAEKAGLGSLVVLLAFVAVSLIALFEFHYFTPLWALWGAGVFTIFRYLEASGHHRSQHLMHQLSSARHPTVEKPAVPETKKAE